MMADPSNDGEPDTLPKPDAAATDVGQWLLLHVLKLDTPGIYPLTVVVAPNGKLKLVGAGGKVVDVPAAARGV